jgi:uncharacterized protein (TIGR03437 family)
MKLGAKTSPLLSLLLACGAAWAAGGPTASPSSLTFTYVAGSGATVKPQTVTIALPASMSTQTLVVTGVSSTEGWLAVSPVSGLSPMALTVTANPTTLDPGSHPGTITVDTKPSSGNAISIGVSFVITGTAPILQVTSSRTFTSPLTIALDPYVTGNPTPIGFSLFVASSGDAIPFSVTAANTAAKGSTGTSKTPVWLRVSQGIAPTLTTSGVALSGSFIQIDVTLDPTALATLDPVSSPFSGTVTIAPAKSNSATTSTPTVVTVTLQVAPGPPGLLSADGTTRSISIFPSHLPAVLPGTTAADIAVVTILGDNFFLPGITSVAINPDGQTSTPISLTPPNLVWISRTILQVTIASKYLSAPGLWDVTVQNGTQSVSTLLYIDDPTGPFISSVVSAASFLASLPDPANLPDYPHISPREIISIFGRNLGPTLTPVQPVTLSGTSSQAYPSDGQPVLVEFLVGPEGTQTSYHAPLILYSPTQINCVVPYEVDGSVSPVTIKVTYNTFSTAEFPVTATTSHPGIFTSGGAGLGQAAVLNFDSTTGSYTVNASSAPAARSSSICLFVTGMGDLQQVNGSPVADGMIATGPIKLVAMNPPQNPTGPSTVNVSIDGQPAVVTYAGASPGAVAGLVQINAIVPLAAKANNTVPITVSIGTGAASQPGVWLAVK